MIVDWKSDLENSPLHTGQVVISDISHKQYRE